MGTAAQASLSLEDETKIGRMVMRGLREQGIVVEDPEVGEYLQSLGLRLSSLAQEGNHDFNFFIDSQPRDQCVRTARRLRRHPLGAAARDKE